jgi:hypothetical protein
MYYTYHVFMYIPAREMSSPTYTYVRACDG